MAHELGHGLHAALAQPQGVFHQGTPLTLAETASVFGEALVFGRLLEAAPDDRARLSLLAERIDGAVATVFRQMAMNRFEHLVHTRRRADGELSVERIGELWVESAERAVRRFGRDHRGLPRVVVLRPSLHQHAGVRLRLRVRAAVGAVRSTPATSRRETRSPRTTWSCWPPAAHAARRSWAAIVGIDLSDPGFWDSGLALVEAQLDGAEAAAARPERVRAVPRRLPSLPGACGGGPLSAGSCACGSAPPGARPRGRPASAAARSRSPSRPPWQTPRASRARAPWSPAR